MPSVWLHCLIVCKSISDTPDGMEVFWGTAIRFEIFSEIQDEIIDGSGGGIHLVSPYTLQDLLT
jgi:hypothetical protein